MLFHIFTLFFHVNNLLLLFVSELTKFRYTRVTRKRRFERKILFLFLKIYLFRVVISFLVVRANQKIFVIVLLWNTFSSKSYVLKTLFSFLILHTIL